MKRKQENPKYELIVINSLDEIPDFASEDDEREFWATHEFSDELWDSLPRAKDDLGEIKLTKRDLKVQVCSWDEVPDFVSEDEERDWWQNREPTWELLQTLPDRKVMPTRLESLRGFVKLAREKRLQKPRKVS